MRPANVLVVDDEIILLSLLKTVFINYGCNVTTANDGDQAIQLLETSVYDLVLTDLQLGQTSGLEVILKAKESSATTLVFMMTGCNEVQYAIAAFSNGVADYLLKPFSMQSLLDRLHTKGFKLSYSKKSGTTGKKWQKEVPARQCDSLNDSQFG
jgi:DNA-binding response OmpR family regulator